MGKAIVGLITVGVMIYALIDCWRSDDSEVRALPRPVWFLVILVPLVGGIAYLVYGAPRGPGGQVGQAGRKVLAPDDDPEFLSSLEQKARERRRQEREERRRQAKEQRREEKEQRREEKERRHDGDPAD